VLSNHKFDAFKQGNKFHNKTSNEPATQESEQQKVTLSFAQMEGKCYCCEKAGHKSPQFCFKDKPKAEWGINKVQQTHAQASMPNTKSEQNASNQEEASKQRKTRRMDRSPLSIISSRRHEELDIVR
jgi:hypothetical protein